MNKKQQPYYLVIGLGASGLSMAKFLNAAGNRVIVTDIDKSAEKNAKICRDLGIETQIGFHDQETFNNAQCLVPSPGIPLTVSYIENARKAGVPVTGELDIFSRHNTLPVIAITGTNGKTTTTTLIGELLAACGKKPFVGGNIGTPLLEQPMRKEANDIIVAEISSFQLDISKDFKPDIALLLNISEDHLDRYDSFEAYADSKWHMFTNQGADDIAVINRQIQGFSEKKRLLDSTVLSFSSEGHDQTELSAKIVPASIEVNFNRQKYRIDTSILNQLHGTHNHENLAAAVLACLAAGCSFDQISEGIKGFKNLPHRMEYVTDINGVSFYNDSKATNTDAVIRALECFDHKIVLILGGREKGTDFSLLTESVRQNAGAVIAIGESRVNVEKAFKGICDVTTADSMTEAVRTGLEKANPGEAVLLSPACASFDMYDNYGHRGNDFKSIVMKLKEQKNG